MADLETGVDPVAIQLEIDVRAEVRSPTFANPAIFRDLHPHRMNVVQLDTYRTCLGWPTEKPLVDVHVNTLASAVGHVLEQRPEPRELLTGAAARWIADEDFYDPISFVWRPISGPMMSYRWRTSTDFAPTLMEDQSYFVDKELFIRTALNFDADSRHHMWSDFIAGFEGNVGYSVLMAVILKSAFGNTAGRPTVGLWSPGAPTPPDEDEFVETEVGFSAKFQGGKLITNSENSNNIAGSDLADAMGEARPVYVGISFGYPTISSYISMGPGKTTVTTVASEDVPVPQAMRIALGRTTGSVLTTADMAILDLGIYDKSLTAAEMTSEIAILSQTYGG